MSRRSKLRLWMLCAALAALALPFTASAQVPLINGFGGTAGYGTSCLGPNDDGSSSAIDLRPAFPGGLRFFDRTHTTMFVNTNGNISFSAQLPTFTPDPFPVADRPMIAPYWADVDIRLTGGRCTGPIGGSGTAPACHNPTENGVWWHVEPGRIIVTWDRVGYYSCHNDRRMSFQLILSAAPECGEGIGNFDVEFRYNICNWTTGDASGGTGGFGGTPAQAGFDAGNSRDFVEIMGSRTGTIHTTLCTNSNVGMPGIWRFGVRGGTVMCPEAGRPCNTGMQGVCADGRTQCVGSGTVCQPINRPGARRCNGLDNDCDGMIDTGDDLCAAGFVCEGAQCVPRCVEGSCFTGEVCTARGTCVEAACATVMCPQGQRCSMGTCIGACDGVTCPAGRVCRNGSCIDPCDGLTCEMGTVCEAGLCVPTCPCRSCSAGTTCRMSDGRCVEDACATVTCGPGTFCRAGACVDACTGAVCPRGERCEAGACVPDMSTADSGVFDSAVPLDDVNFIPRDNGVLPTDTGLTQRDGGADGGRRDGGTLPPTDMGSCACSTPGTQQSQRSTPWIMLGLGAAMIVVRRRRR